MSLQLLLCQLSRQGRSHYKGPVLSAAFGCFPDVLSALSSRALSSQTAASSCAAGECNLGAGTLNSPTDGGRTSNPNLQAAPACSANQADAISGAPRASGSALHGWRGACDATAPSPSPIRSRAPAGSTVAALPAAASPASVSPTPLDACRIASWGPWDPSHSTPAPYSGVRLMSQGAQPQRERGGTNPSGGGGANNPGRGPSAGAATTSNTSATQTPKPRQQQQQQQPQQQQPPPKARQGAGKAQQQPQQLQPAAKELQLRPRISEHDLATKLRRAEGWLEDGLRVQLVVQFKGGDEEGGKAAAALVESVAGRLVGKGQPMGGKRQMKNTWLLTLKPAAPPTAPKQPQQQPAAPAAAAPNAGETAAAA